MTLKEYLQSQPQERIKRAADDLSEAAKIEQEHAALPNAIFDSADQIDDMGFDKPATPTADDPQEDLAPQSPQQSFDLSDEEESKKFIKGMELSHPELVNRLRRDETAWDEMLTLDRQYAERMQRDSGIKFTGDDKSDNDFFRWAYGRGYLESDTSFGSLASAFGRGLWQMAKGAGKLGATAVKSAVNPTAGVELAATAVDAAQAAVSEYQQLGAGLAALTAGDNPQVKMEAMYALAKFSDSEKKTHNSWRKAIDDSFAEVPVDEDSVEFLSEAFDVSNLVGAGAGKMVTRGLKRAGASGAAEMLGKSRTMFGSEAIANVVAKVPLLGTAEKRAILVGQADELSKHAEDAYAEVAASQAKLAAIRATLANNPTWSNKDILLKQIGEAEKVVAAKQASFDAAKAQLDTTRQAVTDALNLEGRGLLNLATAGALEAAGTAVRGTGRTLTRAYRGASEAITGEAENAAFDMAAGQAVGNVVGKGNLITRMGQDMIAAGRTLSQAEASIPYFRRLRQAGDATKLTRGAAAFIDWSHLGWVADKTGDFAKAAAAGAPVSGAFGYVASGGDLAAAAESAGAGAAYGIGGGAYGQWQAYTDPRFRYEELLANRRQFRDTLSTREVGGSSQLQIFDQMDAGDQVALASYAQGAPDVAFRFIYEEGGPSGHYDRENNFVVINTWSSSPIADIFRHEVAHFVERHGLETQVRELYLGDADKGVVGQFTELDKLGNPVFVETTTKDGEKKYSYKLNAQGEKLKAEYEKLIQNSDPAFKMSDEYFSSELFAEQYADRLFRGGFRRDLSRNAIDNVVDALANKPLLKDFMGRIGLVFDGDDRVVGTNVFSGFKKNAEVEKLITSWNSEKAKGAKSEIVEKEDAVLTERDLRDPSVAAKWLQGGGAMRFGPDGKPVYDSNGTPQFLTEKEADAIQRDLANELISEIEKYVADNPADNDLIQRREIVDVNGVKRTVYSGRRIPISVIDALEKQKRFNPHQLAHLRAASASVEKHGVGAMIAHFYQAKMRKLGGRAYKTVAGRWRRDGVVGFQITKDGNVLINSVSWEQLDENAKKAAKTKLARELYSTSGVPIEAAITADVKTYLTNLVDGKPGDTEIGEARRDFINNLLGIRMASNADANPLYETTSAPKIILTNLRLDNINRMSPLDFVAYAWGPQQYRQAKKNARPETSSKREVGANADFSTPPTDEEARSALASDKQPKFGLARDLEPGTPVGLRIDIPAFQRTGKYVVSVHEKAKGNTVGRIVGYDTIVTVDNPTFMSNEAGASKIKSGDKNKFPIATVEGSFNSSREIPADINDWTAVGFDPLDHSYFYDKRTDEPVVGGKQAVSVGNSVFVKEPVFGDRSNFQYRPEAIRARSAEKVAEELGLKEVDEGAKQFGYFMREMNAKGVTPRDVVKAYLITTSSINRRAVPTEKVAKGWADLSYSEKDLRPEDAFAKLLGTTEGQRFLDAAVAGNFDEAAANVMLEKFKPFGLYNTQREYMRNAAENLSKIAESIVNAVKTLSAEDYAEFVRENFKGISFGKVGFMSGMLGRGDLPTVDVRERKLWYGERDVSVDKRILMQVRDRLAQLDIPLTEDLKDYYQTIVHHAVWDRIEGTDTSHAEIKEAMLRFRPDVTQPKSEVEGYTPTKDVKNVPELTLRDLEGKKVFPILADLTAVGLFDGIDSSAVVPVNMHGGPNFPAIPENRDAGVAWANEGKHLGTRKANLLKETDGYAVVTAMSQDTHASNSTTVNAFVNTLAAYVRDGRVKPVGVKKADRAILGLGLSLPSVADPEFGPAVRSARFQDRAAVVNQLSRAEFEDYGFPPARRVLDATRDPEFHGVDYGDALLVLKLDPEDTVVTLGENGTPTHPDYTYGIRGKIVGKLVRPLPAKLLFSEHYAARRAAGAPESSDPRSLAMKMPVATITPEKVQAAARLETTVARNAQQMRAALAAATGSWATTDLPVKEGGVGIADFVRALRENKSAPSLTPYTEEAVKAKVKSGDMKVYKLENADIYFALVLDGDKKVISSVVNNEPGARGVAGPAVLAKAIQEGATHLDCFAVSSQKYPKGFLPELYTIYGFVEDGRVDFSREFFDADWKAVGENPDIKFADLLHLWQSEGWNPSSQKPQVTFMRLHQELTDNASRQQYHRRLLEAAADRMADRGRITRRGVQPDAQPNPAGAGAGGAGGDNAGTNRGMAGDRGGLRSAAARSLDQFRDIVRDLARLTDEDAKLRGLNIDQLRELRQMLQTP